MHVHTWKLCSPYLTEALSRDRDTTLIIVPASEQAPLPLRQRKFDEWLLNHNAEIKF